MIMRPLLWQSATCRSRFHCESMAESPQEAVKLERFTTDQRCACKSDFQEYACLFGRDRFRRSEVEAVGSIMTLRLSLKRDFDAQLKRSAPLFPAAL